MFFKSYNYINHNYINFASGKLDKHHKKYKMDKKFAFIINTKYKYQEKIKY